MKRSLCLFILLICFSTPVFSQDNLKDCKIFHQYIEKDVQPQLTPEYISRITKITNNYYGKNDMTNALKCADYLVDITGNFYGENTIEMADALLLRGDIYARMVIPNKALNDFEKASEYANGNVDILNRILQIKVGIYTNLEQPNKSLEFLNNVKNINPVDKYMNLKQIYSMKGMSEKELDMLNKYFKSIQPDDEQKYEYYKSLANIYIFQGKYNLADKYISKAQSMIPSLNSDRNFNIDINNLKFNYYKEIDCNKEAEEILNENYEYITKNNIEDEREVYNTNALYLYSSQGNKAAKKHYDNVQKIYSEYPDDSYMKIWKKEALIEYYRESEQIAKANELANNVFKHLKQYKEDAPILYAKFLKEAYKNKSSERKYQEAKSYLDERLKIFQTYAPDTYSSLTEIYKDYGEYYSNIQDFDNAIKAYNQALKYNEYTKKINDITDIYENLASLYSKTDKIKALSYIDKAVEKANNSYGQNNSKTYKILFTKYYIYNELNMQEEAGELLAEITNKANRIGISGKVEEIKYQINAENAYLSERNKNYTQALNYADIALNSAEKQWQKDEMYKLCYRIYSENGNKVKAIRYKKYAQ